MARSSLVALLLLAAAAGSLASRDLLQTGNARCPDGCDLSGGCVRDTTTGGYRCVKCLGSLIVMRDTGRCGCARGRYAGSDTCNDCEVGYFCKGGEYVEATSAPAREECPSRDVGMTTLGTRAISNQQCVNKPGYSYTWNATAQAPSAVECAADTYSAGLRKQPSCTPCGPGLTTSGSTTNDAATDCQLKPGYYLRSPGVAALCPKGEFNGGSNLVSSCTKCPDSGAEGDGVTTVAEGSTSASDCIVLLESYEAVTQTSGVITETKKCQQDFYCPGGTLVVLDALTNAVPDTGRVACFEGTRTKSFGAITRDQCLVPPGYAKTASAIAKCNDGTSSGDGMYREGWKYVAPGGTVDCDSCGTGFRSNTTEQLERYAASNAAAAADLVAGAKTSCYIRRGQGSYQTPAGAYYAISCSSNNYGVAGTTYGLNTNPCRDCPSGMQTEGTAPSINFVDADTAGYYDPKACVTKAGFGYNGRIATACQQGYYNGGSNYDQCTACPYGTTTVVGTPGTDQNELADCFIAPGFGKEDGVIRVCPVGTFQDVIRSDSADNSATCKVCTTGTTTTEEGANQAESSSCNVCAVGYGGAALSDCANGDQCGCSSATAACTTANYGPAGRSPGTTACVACPTMTQGFTFDWNQDTQNFTPDPVAKLGAESVSDCLAEFTQVEDNVWELKSAGSNPITATNGTAYTVADCAAACRSNAKCMWFTFDYAANQCALYLAPTGSAQYTGFKVAPAGDVVATTSVKRNALASGRYTWWKSALADVGTEISSASKTVEQCQKDCNADPLCAAIVFTGTITGTGEAASGTCSMRKGTDTVDTGLRSLTSTRVTQLSFATAA